MKKTTRDKIRMCALLVLMVLGAAVAMLLLTACGTGVRTTSRYDLDVVNATSDFYVNDFADIFTEEQEKQLMEKAVNFDQETGGIQVVITTVKTLNDAVVGYEKIVEDQEGNRIETEQGTGTPRFTVEEVAYSMYKEYAIGQDDMGILILISVGTGNGDGDIRIETGRQMQFYITDGLSGELLDDYAMDYLYEGQYAEGMISLQDGVLNEIKKQVPADWQSKITVEESETISETTEETTGAVAGAVGDNSGSDDVNANDNSEPKDSGKGILWGLFGSIGAALAAVVALIGQKKKSNAERQEIDRRVLAQITDTERRCEAKIAEKDASHACEVQEWEEKYQRLKRENDRAYSEMEREKNGRIAELEQALRDAREENGTLTNKFESLADKYARVQRLYPDHDFDNEVEEMIQEEFKASARDVDGCLSKTLNTAPTKDNIDVFRDALELYDSTSSDVRKYVTSDRNAIVFLHSEAVRLKEEFERAEQEKRDRARAQAAYNEIRGVFDSNPNGNYRTYEALNAALAVFLGLTAAQKAFFPDNSLIENLKRVHRVAEDDHDDYSAAQNAEESVRNIIGYMSSADEDDRDKLGRAKRYYDALTSSQKEYFSSELIGKLNRLINQAEEDYVRQERRRKEERRRREEEERRRREEEERRRREEAERRRREEAERRRRQAAQRSSYHSSSHSGRGGRPSGGGASRRF